MANSSGSASPPSWIQLANPPRVDEGVFIGVAWGGVALSGLFLAGRGYARTVAFRRLFWDDGFALVAWLMFVASTSIWQEVKDYLYEDLYVDAGLLYPPPADYETNTTTYLHASAAVQVLFFSSLWFIKFSVLIFFRRLDSKVRSQAILWWCITAIVVASWIITLAIIPWNCITRDFLYISQTCTNAAATDHLRAVLTANTCFDVITDLLITLLPINLLWKVRISLQRKMALLGIFSLTIVVIIFAIVRVAASTSYSFQFDQSWLYLWSSIEQTVSIMVACLASFPVLFSRTDHSTRRRPTFQGSATMPTAGARSWLSSRSRKSAYPMSGADFDDPTGVPIDELPAGAARSRDAFFKPDQIHVKSDISAVSAARDSTALGARSGSAAAVWR